MKKNIWSQLKNKGTQVGISLFLISTQVGNISADGPGVDEAAFKSLISNFVDPIKNVLIWVVPTVAVIGALIMGIKYFFKNEQEREDYEIITKLINLAIVASLFQSIAILFRIFGVSA